MVFKNETELKVFRENAFAAHDEIMTCLCDMIVLGAVHEDYREPSERFKEAMVKLQAIVTGFMGEVTE